MNNDERVILDASAFLALIKDEPGADQVRLALGGGSVMSAVNWAEVLSKLADYGLSPVAEADRLRRQGVGDVLVIAPFDDRQARESAALRQATRRAGLSLGDRACLALGRVQGLKVLTADRAWHRLRVGVEVVVIR